MSQDVLVLWIVMEVVKMSDGINGPSGDGMRGDILDELAIQPEFSSIFQTIPILFASS